MWREFLSTLHFKNVSIDFMEKSAMKGEVISKHLEIGKQINWTLHKLQIFS
jgi:hypothetical protein